MPDYTALHKMMQGMIGPAAGDWELGSIKNYSLVHVLGLGGMAIVYLAFDRSTGDWRAVKCVRPDCLTRDGDHYRTRFDIEVKAMKGVRSDLVTKILDSGSHEHVKGCSVPYLCMEFVQGRTLEQKLQDWQGHLPQREVARIGMEAARGLGHIHAANCFHRDLSTNNILLDTMNNEKVKLTDFGLAFLEKQLDPNLSFDHTVGTLPFIAPERWKNNRDITAQGDLFSLGCVLYRALAGCNAFQAKQGSTLNDDPPSLLDLCPHVDRGLASLVMRLLEKDPLHRPPDAEHLVSHLEFISFSLVQSPTARHPEWPKPSSDSVRQVLGGIAGRTFGVPLAWTNGAAGVLLGLARQAQLTTHLMLLWYEVIRYFAHAADDCRSNARNPESEQELRQELATYREGFLEVAVNGAPQVGGLPKLHQAIQNSLADLDHFSREVTNEIDRGAPDWGSIPQKLKLGAKSMLDHWWSLLKNHHLVNDLLLSSLDRFDAPATFAATFSPLFLTTSVVPSPPVNP